MTEDYKLIPMNLITDEARKLAVAWMECEDKDWIGQKHKLASDIMCYAVKYHKQEMKNILLKFCDYISFAENDKEDKAIPQFIDNFICSITPNQNK
jgi:hypothetical protein